MTYKKREHREYERSFISLNSFPIDFSCNVQGTNYVGVVWDISPKSCSCLFSKTTAPDTETIGYFIESESAVILTLSDTTGITEKIAAYVRRQEEFSYRKNLIAFEFLEPLDSKFTSYFTTETTNNQKEQ
jgi:hypothetical protein